MKKSIAILLALVVLVSCGFAACSSGKSDDKTSTTVKEGLESADTEYGTELDEDGNPVDVEYVKDKDGKVTAYVIDTKTGERKKDKSGKEVTVKVTEAEDEKENKDSKNDNNSNTDNDSNKDDESNNKSDGPGTTEATKNTAVVDDSAGTTSSELTTIEAKDDVVPKTSDSGERVQFNSKDLQSIASMLEVPGITAFSYENSDGINAQMAVHVAIWMAQREGLNSSSFPSGTVVLDLFKYYGQTVVNFKSNCNDAAKKEECPISYNASDGIFKITDSEKKEQTVKISRVENLGNNNYYKVSGSVSGVKNISKVTAVVQKNKLDTSLGFSIKAVKWSK